MHIVYIHQYFNTPVMSGGTRSYEMARRLVSAGHTVDLISMGKNGDQDKLWSVEDIDGINVHWLRGSYSNNLGFARRLIAFFYFAIHAAVRCIKVGGEIVFATSTPLTVAIPGIIASKWHRIPLVFEVRDLWPEAPIAIGALKNPIVIGLARLLEDWAYRSSSHVVALSPGMAEGVASRGVPLEKITTIPNSSDLDLFQGEEADPEAFLRQHPYLRGRSIVLYPGTLGDVNGVEYMGKMASAAKEKGSSIAFVVVGEGRQRLNIEQSAKKCGVLGQNFFLIDAVPKRNMPSVFAAASIILSLVIPVPALWKNSANKVFDSLAAAKPIFINHGGWQADFIRRNSVGGVLDANNPESASAYLIVYLSDKDVIDADGSRALALAKSDFSRDLLFAKFEKILLSAVADRRSTRGNLDELPSSSRG